MEEVPTCQVDPLLPHGDGAVQIRGLRKVWPGGKVAVHDLNLDMHSGEIFVLLGHNGELYCILK